MTKKNLMSENLKEEIAKELGVYEQVKKDFAGHFRINYYMASVAELREEREEDPILFTSAGDCWGNTRK